MWNGVFQLSPFITRSFPYEHDEDGRMVCRSSTTWQQVLGSSPLSGLVSLVPPPRAPAQLPRSTRSAWDEKMQHFLKKPAIPRLDTPEKSAVHALLRLLYAQPSDRRGVTLWNLECALRWAERWQKPLGSLALFMPKHSCYFRRLSFGCYVLTSAGRAAAFRLIHP